MYLYVKYIKSVLWTVAKRLSYIQDARCLKVNKASIDEQKSREVFSGFRWSARRFQPCSMTQSHSKETYLKVHAVIISCGVLIYQCK